MDGKYSEILHRIEREAARASADAMAVRDTLSTTHGRLLWVTKNYAHLSDKDVFDFFEEAASDFGSTTVMQQELARNLRIPK